MATRPRAGQGQIQRVQPHRRGLEDRRVRLHNQQERRRIKEQSNRSTRLGLERWDPMRLWIHPRPEQRRFEHPMAQGDVRDGPHAMRDGARRGQRRVHRGRRRETALQALRGAKRLPSRMIDRSASEPWGVGRVWEQRVVRAVVLGRRARGGPAVAVERVGARVRQAGRRAGYAGVWDQMLHRDLFPRRRSRRRGPGVGT